MRTWQSGLTRIRWLMYSPGVKGVFTVMLGSHRCLSSLPALLMLGSHRCLSSLPTKQGGNAVISDRHILLASSGWA